jgi:hypothetical protein
VTVLIRCPAGCDALIGWVVPDGRSWSVTSVHVGGARARSAIAAGWAVLNAHLDVAHLDALADPYRLAAARTAVRLLVRPELVDEPDPPPSSTAAVCGECGASLQFDPADGWVGADGGAVCPAVQTMCDRACRPHAGEQRCGVCDGCGSLPQRHDPVVDYPGRCPRP